MRTLFAVSLFALLLGVGVVALIETDPGYVLVSYGQFTLETSLWVGLVVLAVVLFVFYLLLRTVYQVLSGRRIFSGWLGTRRSHQAAKNTARGFISYTEGDWARARRYLLRGVQNNDTAIVNYLLAARASDHLQEPEQVVEFLQAAGAEDRSAAAAIDIVRVENSLRAGEYAKAQALLDESSKNLSKHSYVLTLQRQAYEGLGETDKLLALIPELRKQKQISEQESVQLAQSLQLQRLRAATNAADLTRIFQGMSTESKQTGELVQAYVTQLIEFGDHASAEKTIRRALKREWDSELVRLYGLIDNDTASARLSQAEKWLDEHPGDAQLLLCLGRLCLRDSLWGKARDYFERSFRVDPTAEVCAELGRLLIGLGEPKVAGAYYREGLSNSETVVLPELPVPDKVIDNHHTLERDSV